MSKNAQLIAFLKKVERNARIAHEGLSAVSCDSTDSELQAIADALNTMNATIIEIARLHMTVQ